MQKSGGNSFRGTHTQTYMGLGYSASGSKCPWGIEIAAAGASHSSNSLWATGQMSPAAPGFCPFLSSRLPGHAPTNLLGHQEGFFLGLPALAFPSQAQSIHFRMGSSLGPSLVSPILPCSCWGAKNLPQAIWEDMDIFERILSIDIIDQ